MGTSRLDHIFRSLLLTKFFTKGWGNPENLKRIFEFRKIISNREKCRFLVDPDYPIHIDKEREQKEVRLIEGHFTSPFDECLPGIMPEEVKTANFQMILPKKWSSDLKPVCLHLAGTGDHGFWRRRTLMARPMLKEAGIASILLENPYYGSRKPKLQVRSSLHNVSDLFVMGGALILETLALFHWCERQGYGPLGITGISMGGNMASLAATNWHKPLALVPCLSWSTASAVFTQGVLSGAIPWKLLQEQYSADSIYEDEVAKHIESPEVNTKNKAFVIGQHFARDFPESLTRMEEFQEKHYKGTHDNKPGEDFLSEYKTSEWMKSDMSQVPSERNTNQTFESNNRNTNNDNNNNCTVMDRAVSGHSQVHSTSSNQLHTSSQWQASSFNPLTMATERIIQKLNIDTALKKLKPARRSAGKNMQTAAVHFMRGVMDECTHIGNFSVPVDTSLVIIICAQMDGYVPRDKVLSLEELWKGAEVRYIDSGHISAYLFNQQVFRKAIIDAFDRQIKKYYS